MSKQAKEPKAKKSKKGAASADKVSLTGSTRALASIRRIKARGGLAGFALAAAGAFMHGSAPAQVIVRGLEGGVAGYLVCWFAAVTAWRAVIRAEVRVAMSQAIEQRGEGR